MYDCIIVDARDVEIHITRDPRCVYHCNGVRFPRGGYKRPGSDPWEERVGTTTEEAAAESVL